MKKKVLVVLTVTILLFSSASNTVGLTKSDTANIESTEELQQSSDRASYTTNDSQKEIDIDEEESKASESFSIEALSQKVRLGESKKNWNLKSFVKIRSSKGYEIPEEDYEAVALNTIDTDFRGNDELQLNVYSLKSNEKGEPLFDQNVGVTVVTESTTLKSISQKVKSDTTNEELDELLNDTIDISDHPDSTIERYIEYPDTSTHGEKTAIVEVCERLENGTTVYSQHSV